MAMPSSHGLGFAFIGCPPSSPVSNSLATNSVRFLASRQQVAASRTDPNFSSPLFMTGALACAAVSAVIVSRASRKGKIQNNGRHKAIACRALDQTAAAGGFIGPVTPASEKSVVALKASDQSSEGNDGPSEKTIETMRKFSNQYAKVTDTYFCSDLSVASVVVIGLAHHKETLGAPLCPCRHYEDKEKEVKNGYWNCPCVPMRERHECHCMLFLEDSNPFAGDAQHLDLEEILKMKGQV